MQDNKYVKTEYRQVRDFREEGFEFNLTMRYVADFFIQKMKGCAKRDTPDILIHYSRDWEYPWTLLKSEIKPNDKILDCGSGFSPLPFIWSTLGGKSYAVDKDIMICSRFAYALHLIFSLERNWRKIRRITKPDNWGPMWTGLLKKYKVDYQNGDLTELPYEDEFFDVVSCISVLEHLPFEERIKGVREMARVVKKGGKLIITYDKKEDLTPLFIRESNMTPIEIVSFSKSNNPQNRPEVVGIYLIKPTI